MIAGLGIELKENQGPEPAKARKHMLNFKHMRIPLKSMGLFTGLTLSMF